MESDIFRFEGFKIYIYIYPQKERKKKTNLFRGPIKIIYHEGVSNMIAD